MAKKKPVQTIHPMKMMEALDALNNAASLYTMKVRALSDGLEIAPHKASDIATQLKDATDAFHTVIWPED